MLTRIGLYQIFLYCFILLMLAPPLGWYIAKVYEGQAPLLSRFGRPFEKLLYRLCRIQADQAMDWKQYLSALLIFNLLGLLAAYIIQRLQAFLPLNPQHFPAPSADLALNTAASFVTNTDWQAFGGETTLSYLTQMLVLTTQNFLSAATGMSIFVALARGMARHENNALGNFWVDAVRGILYILLPLSFIFACILVSEGVIQNYRPNQHIQALEMKEQVIPMGPVASQTAIVQLGTNGGGFFNTNGAHPFANPTPLTNFLETLALLLIPAALCYTFGVMVNDRRQGLAILFAMFVVFIPFAITDLALEQKGNIALSHLGLDQQMNNPFALSGNMEGKEVRFGIIGSTLWTVATTASSNGSVNSMLDSYTPLGGLVPLWMIHLGEVIFGGIGSGICGMLMLVIITVFVAGLMVGRTPEFIGKKIEPFEMKMASVAILVMPMIVLLSSALACVIPAGIDAIGNPGPHGFTEMLYAFTSMGNNNGSSFAGLNANTPFYNILGSFVILVGRFWIAIPVLALAGSLVKKKKIQSSTGTLATHTPLFIFLLVSIMIIVGGLSFLPALALGPIVEQLNLWGHYA